MHIFQFIADSQTDVLFNVFAQVMISPQGTLAAAQIKGLVFILAFFCLRTLIVIGLNLFILSDFSRNRIRKKLSITQ